MICDELSEDEIYQAYLIYASLHGMDTDEATVRERIANYVERNQPDELIDDAILAYAEDCIIAPPDVVLAKWGSSRYYELDRSPHRLARHRTCDSWFENGCRFVSPEDTPRFVHFWTTFELSDDRPFHLPQGSISQQLQHGTQLRLVLEPGNRVNVVHGVWGVLGNAPKALAVSLHDPPMCSRKFLALVDEHESTYQLPNSGGVVVAQRQRLEAAGSIRKLLVASGAENVTTESILEYAAEAFLADRNKC